MAGSGPAAPTTYHVVLIGVDAYPGGYTSLSGCVNDIDALEELLLDEPRTGVAPERVRITRFAAPYEGATSSSRLQAQTLPPTRENVVAALQALAGPDVGPNDRVLIYYSGHGTQERPEGSTVWHEAIVLHDGRDIQPLYDVELNGLVNAVAARTRDVTVVLDSCNAGGAMRDLVPEEARGQTRYLDCSQAKLPKPDPALSGPPVGTRGEARPSMLRTFDPAYFALLACQADERANEGAVDGVRRHGFLTRALISLILRAEPEGGASLRWADLWPDIVDGIGDTCARMGRAPQHPAWIGRTERRVFGGRWTPHDPGYSLRASPDGTFTVGAGTLMGITPGCVLAVYGPEEPPHFPTLGSEDDLKARIGQLEVTEAERVASTAKLVGAAFDPTGARARLIRPGESDRLRGLLDPPNPDLAAFLEESPLLRVVSSRAGEPEAVVRSKVKANGEDGGWTIGDLVVEEMATVPREERFALRAGLEAYYRFTNTLRLAKRCNSPELDSRLDVRLMNCQGLPLPAGSDLRRPDLPEAPKDAKGLYCLPDRIKVAIELGNLHSSTLRIYAFDCSADGRVSYLGNAELRGGDRQVIWMGGVAGKPFSAWSPLPSGGTDRLVAIATTSTKFEPQRQEVPKSIQDAVNVILTRGLGDPPTPKSSAPVELWTAVVVPFWIEPSQ